MLTVHPRIGIQIRKKEIVMMKRLALLPLLLILLVSPAYAWDSWRISATLDILVSDTTVTFTLPSKVGSASYLIVPTITSSSIALSGSVDGTNFYTIASNYSATALIDFTYVAGTGGKVLLMPDLSPFRYLRITVSSQSANRTFTLFGK